MSIISLSAYQNIATGFQGVHEYSSLLLISLLEDHNGQMALIGLMQYMKIKKKEKIYLQ